MRQSLADKVCGTKVGLWLLIPEHLRLGSWDLLSHWAGPDAVGLSPRLAMQMVNESALCVTGIRAKRCLTQSDFALASGLPYVATDSAIHNMLDAHSVAQAEQLQVALGKIRLASGHFECNIFAIDPHRTSSYSKRLMRKRKSKPTEKAKKTAQTFFCLDAETHQPLCLSSEVSGRTVSQATPGLLDMMTRICGEKAAGALVLADSEHHAAKLLDHAKRNTPFSILIPMAKTKTLKNHLKAIPAENFRAHWAGYATTRESYTMGRSTTGPMSMLVQRFGERPDEYKYNSFLCSDDRDELDALTLDYPKRWHIEEFFNTHQALGWQRAGTQNLNIRYGQMTMALFAQASLEQLRKRLPPAWANWNAAQFAEKVLRGLQGDIRVHSNKIIVTFYNAPEESTLRHAFQHLPTKLEAEGVDPRIPWLCNFKLDFRFK